MLILVRKVQQSIWIEGDISIHVLGIERDRVKLGVVAPDHVKVMRQELLNREEAWWLEREAGPEAAAPHRPGRQ